MEIRLFGNVDLAKALHLVEKTIIRIKTKEKAVIDTLAIGGIVWWAVANHNYWSLCLVLVVGFFTMIMASQIDGARNFYRLRAEYNGLIPDEVRAKIDAARIDFNPDRIFILAEGPDWRMDRVVVPRADPLVLGFANDHFWLIAEYETSPAEEYVSAELTK